MKRHLYLRQVALWIWAVTLTSLSPLAAQHEGHGAADSSFGSSSGSSASASGGLQTSVGPYRMSMTTDPPVIPIGKAKILLRVTDASGKPVEGAQVRVLTRMPGMNMGEREETARAQSGSSGLYVAPAAFPMAGGYEVSFKISAAAGEASGVFAVQPGQNTAGGGGMPLSRLLLWAGAALLLVFMAYRMRQTGQRVPWRNFLSPPVLGGLAVLAAMLALVLYGVRHWRRPGSMTPLEAQGMEMSMPAPPGTLAVELAKVRRGLVQSRVRYTGQAVGYIEQEVYVRVTGNLLWMPFYAGQRVRRGQLLARLDTSQIEPQIAQQRAAQTMAQQNAISAQGGYRQALANVSRARAEVAAKRGELAEAISAEHKARAEINSRQGALAEAVSQERKTHAAVGLAMSQVAEAISEERKARSIAGGRRGAVTEAQSAERKARAALQEATTALRAARGAAAEAQSDLEATREDKSNAESDLEAAQSQVTDAEAQLQAARADEEYWTREIERMWVLLKEGAVSREEFQREQAQAQNATAKVRQAQARVTQTQAEVRGAQSRIRRADALIRSAQAKAEQAEASVEGNQNRIEQAQADIAGAGARVRQMEAESEGAGAGIGGAAARIRQMEAGVRSARAEVTAAGARIQQMQEDVRAARAEAAGAAARVEQAKAELEAAESGVRGAQAQVEAARGGLGQAEAGIAQARAGVASATTARGYTAIRALVDGVVTQRLISPGTLVQPGQAILKVAQINPIRLQANVAEADLKRLRVGVSVTISDQTSVGQRKDVVARITSVAPAVDPQTRTGLVEAIVPNGRGRFLPGEFVVMHLETGQSRNNLVVPVAAVQKRAAATGEALSTQTQSYIWVAEPSAGQWTVQQVEVQTGVSDGTDVEVLAGLREGQQVVVTGYQNLNNGDTVTTTDMTQVEGTGTAKAADGAQTASVMVTEKGFEPATISLKVKVPARLTFTRKTAATCATDVVFPDYKIKKPLSLNQPVIVEFTPDKAGELTFGCGMDLMLRGKLVVQ